MTSSGEARLSDHMKQLAGFVRTFLPWLLIPWLLITVCRLITHREPLRVLTTYSSHVIARKGADRSESVAIGPLITLDTGRGCGSDALDR